MQILRSETVERLKPSIIKIFLVSLYVWTRILLLLNTLANLMLKLVIISIPNIIMPNITPDIPVQIVRAVDASGYDITKKLKLFMNFQWDTDMCDNGGIDLDSFCEMIGSSIIWISYILECDVSCETCDKFLQFVDSMESTNDNSPVKISSLSGLRKNIRTIVVNTSKKVIYKLKENSDEVSQESILFGEVNFF